MDRDIIYKGTFPIKFEENENCPHLWLAGVIKESELFIINLTKTISIELSSGGLNDKYVARKAYMEYSHFLFNLKHTIYRINEGLDQRLIFDEVEFYFDIDIAL